VARKVVGQLLEHGLPLVHGRPSKVPRRPRRAVRPQTSSNRPRPQKTASCFLVGGYCKSTNKQPDTSGVLHQS
jgi:hypothetical protein